MSSLVLLYAILGIAAVVVIGAGIYWVKRRHDSLPPAPDQSQLEPRQPEEPAGKAAAEQPETQAEAKPSTPQAHEPAKPQVVEPEPVAGRMQRLRSRLAGSGKMGQSLLSILSRADLSEADWEEFEETLLMADLGLDATQEVLDSVRQQLKVRGSADAAVAKQVLRQELLKIVDPTLDRSLNLERTNDEQGAHPAVLLMVGVNGTGKTTTVGKLARLLVAEGKTALLGAADTFRAAAAEQLATWGERVGVNTVRSEVEGADPASVAFDAVKQGHSEDVDVVLVDTAGRLQNKSTLMDELGKVKRVMEKQAPVSEVLLVLDATTGQNGLRQAEVFSQVVDVTGVVLTKLDGSAKGGIVVAVQRALGVPVKLVGLGEGADDLAPFNAEDFVDAIIG